MCEPFPDSSLSVTRFPMKVEKKKAREAACAVNVLSWRDKATGQRWVVLVRRPETGNKHVGSYYTRIHHFTLVFVPKACSRVSTNSLHYLSELQMAFL
jgi:hypothetical protein